MQPLFLRFLAIVLLTTSAAYGQSLGDVARENREKKAAEDNLTASSKIITNNDLQKDAIADAESPEEKPEPVAEASATTASQRAAERRAAHRALERSTQQRMAEQRVANLWKRQILTQKAKIAALQGRIDQLNAEIRSTYGSVQYEAPYSRSQARQLQRVSQMQQQLDEQKVQLADMQESARRAGMHTAVYDP